MIDRLFDWAHSHLFDMSPRLAHGFCRLWCLAIVDEHRTTTSTGAYVGNPHDDPIWEEVADELARAMAKFGPMASGHEALGVIEEEFMEFRSAVFWGVDQRGRPADPRDEAIQLAAMAVRYLVDVAGRDGR